MQDVHWHGVDIQKHSEHQRDQKRKRGRGGKGLAVTAFAERL